MNELTVSSSTLKMNTVEIAERTGKRHRNVLRDTRKMLIQLYGEGGLLRFEQTYKDAQGKEYPCYALPKNEILTLVSGYSISLRMKIISRWRELEDQERQGTINRLKSDQENLARRQKKEQCSIKNLKKEFFAIKNMADHLKLSRNEIAKAYCEVNKKYGLSTEYFSHLDESSPRVSRSMAYLLEEHGIAYDDEDQGFIDHCMQVRKMIKIEDRTLELFGIQTTYKPVRTLIGEGLKYGENKITNSLYPSDKKPFYFEDTFLEFYKKIMPTWEEVMGPDNPKPGFGQQDTQQTTD